MYSTAGAGADLSYAPGDSEQQSSQTPGMDEPPCDFDYLYARYLVECVRNANSPLTPDELRALIVALADASWEKDWLPRGG